MGGVNRDMQGLSVACCDAIGQQNKTSSDLKHQMSDINSDLVEVKKKQGSDEIWSGSAAARSSSAPPSTTVKTNLFCGPRDLPSLQQRRCDAEGEGLGHGLVLAD